MSRLFELRSHEAGGDVVAVIDLEKISLVRVETQTGHRYERWFADGHESHDLVPPEAAKQFLEAYREHLRGPDPAKP